MHQDDIDILFEGIAGKMRLGLLILGVAMLMVAAWVLLP